MPKGQMLLPLWAVAVSAGSQLMWGLQPVFARYLQLTEYPPLTVYAALGGVALVNAVFLSGLATAIQLVQLLRRPSKEEVGDAKLVSANAQAASNLSDNNHQSLARRRRRKRQLAALGYGMLAIARMLTNFVSVRMTEAFNVQMTASFLLLEWRTVFSAHIGRSVRTYRMHRMHRCTEHIAVRLCGLLLGNLSHDLLCKPCTQHAAECANACRQCSSPFSLPCLQTGCFAKRSTGRSHLFSSLRCSALHSC